MKTFVRMFAVSYTYTFKEDRPLPPAIQAKVDLLRAAADEAGHARLRYVGVRDIVYHVDPDDFKTRQELETIALYTPEIEGRFEHPRAAI